MKKLLNKTMFYSALVSASLLILSAPLFYLLIERLYTHQVDEGLRHKRDIFVNRYLSQFDAKTVETWNNFNQDLKLTRTSGAQPELFLTKFFTDSTENEKEPYRLLLVPVKIKGNDYSLEIKSSLVETEDVVAAISLLYLILLATLLSGLYFINRALSQKTWKPFYSTLKIIENFNIETADQPKFADTTIIEFKRMNSSISKLIERNVNSYKMQKEFTENASHELQTPLAVFQSKLDILLQDPLLTKGQAAVLQSLYEASGRLSRLNKNLLVLAKLDANIFPETEDLNLENILKFCWGNFVEQADHRNIVFSINAVSAPQVRANKGLVEILLNNLLSNAVQNNIEGGIIKVLMTDKSLQITNTGSIQPLHANKLFNRFQIINNQYKGNGLGLAIVAAVARKYNWEIGYNHVESAHSFTLRF